MFIRKLQIKAELEAEYDNEEDDESTNGGVLSNKDRNRIASRIDKDGFIYGSIPDKGMWSVIVESDNGVLKYEDLSEGEWTDIANWIKDGYVEGEFEHFTYDEDENETSEYLNWKLDFQDIYDKYYRLGGYKKTNASLNAAPEDPTNETDWVGNAFKYAVEEYANTWDVGSGNINWEFPDKAQFFVPITNMWSSGNYSVPQKVQDYIDNETLMSENAITTTYVENDGKEKLIGAGFDFTTFNFFNFKGTQYDNVHYFLKNNLPDEVNAFDEYVSSVIAEEEDTVVWFICRLMQVGDDYGVKITFEDNLGALILDIWRTGEPIIAENESQFEDALIAEFNKAKGAK